MAIRIPLATSDGTVLPSAWKMPLQVKMNPVATKFQEMMRRNSPPTPITAPSPEKAPTSVAGAI